MNDKLAYVMVTARKLMAEHGLNSWSFRYNNRKLTCGVCHYCPNERIELSKHFVLATYDFSVIHKVLLHEIAHALVGPGHGHDEVWKVKCAEIGGSPSRCIDEAPIIPYTYRALCPTCNDEFYRHRQVWNAKSGGYSYCVKCGPVRGKLTFRKIGV